MISTLIAAAAVVATLHGAAPVDDASDFAFLYVVRANVSAEHGNVADATLTAVGHDVCAELDSGQTKLQVIRAMMAAFNGTGALNPLTVGEASAVTGAATGAYCPRHNADPYA